MSREEFFTRLADETDGVPSERAPASVKARLYSALVMAQAAIGPLRSLPLTLAAGRPLCVFEHVLRIVVPSGRVASTNPCRVCHARILAEHFDEPPISWPHCPYVQFRRG